MCLLVGRVAQAAAAKVFQTEKLETPLHLVPRRTKGCNVPSVAGHRLALSWPFSLEHLYRLCITRVQHTTFWNGARGQTGLAPVQDKKTQLELVAKNARDVCKSVKVSVCQLAAAYDAIKWGEYISVWTICNVCFGPHFGYQHLARQRAMPNSPDQTSNSRLPIAHLEIRKVQPLIRYGDGKRPKKNFYFPDWVLLP